jgi:hypothetical protein
LEAFFKLLPAGTVFDVPPGFMPIGILVPLRDPPFAVADALDVGALAFGTLAVTVVFGVGQPDVTQGDFTGNA